MLIGDSGVGKTRLLSQGTSPVHSFQRTLGIDFRVTYIDLVS